MGGPNISSNSILAKHSKDVHKDANARWWWKTVSISLLEIVTGDSTVVRLNRMMTAYGDDHQIFSIDLVGAVSIIA